MNILIAFSKTLQILHTLCSPTHKHTCSPCRVHLRLESDTRVPPRCGSPRGSAAGPFPGTRYAPPSHPAAHPSEISHCAPAPHSRTNKKTEHVRFQTL